MRERTPTAVTTSAAFHSVPGYVLAGCPGAPKPFPEFRFTKASVEIHGDTVLDVDITTSFSSCP